LGTRDFSPSNNHDFSQKFRKATRERKDKQSEGWLAARRVMVG